MNGDYGPAGSGLRRAQGFRFRSQDFLAAPKFFGQCGFHAVKNITLGLLGGIALANLPCCR
jgi:hypothetical protein